MATEIKSTSIKSQNIIAEPQVNKPGSPEQGQIIQATGTGNIAKGIYQYSGESFFSLDNALGDLETLRLVLSTDTSAVDFNSALNSTSTLAGNTNAVPHETSTGTGLLGALEIPSTGGDALLTEFDANKVFRYYSAGANNNNDYFGIPVDIPAQTRGQNIVIKFKYRTEEASADTSDGDFQVAVWDKTNGKKTTSTNTSTVAAGSDITVASSTGMAVGDKIWLESGGNAVNNVGNSITQAYITEVTNSTTIKISETWTPASTAGSLVVSGWLSSKTEGLLPEADSDTNKVGKDYSIAVKTEEDTEQVVVWFSNKSTTTNVIELFFDGILVSQNKFLQASSQTKTEFYFIDGSATDVWDASGTCDHFTWDVSLFEVGFNSPAVSDSKLLSFGDITGPGTYGTVTAVTAKQNIILDVGFTAYSNNSGECKIIDSSGNNLAASYAPNSSAAGFENTNATINLAKDDYIFFNNHDNGSRIGMFTFSATPQTSDVILLESQDEIFTGWNEFTPVCGLTGGTKSLNKGFWRRVGSEMEVKISVAWSSKFTGGAATFDLPSGYSIDTGVIPTPLASLETDFGHAVVWDDSAGIPAEGRVTYSDTNTVKATWLNQTMTTYAAVINPGGTLAGQGGGWISTVSGGSGAYTITFSTGFFFSFLGLIPR